MLKIPIAGDGGVGKTSLIRRYVEETFSQSYLMTIGASFHIKRIVLDQTEITIQLWDTAGQERFVSVRTMYYAGSKGIILVYDVTRRESFSNLQHWCNEIQKNTSGSTLIVIGNKIDLETQRIVSIGEARNFATSIGALYAETSAKTGQGVNEAMLQLVQTIYAKEKPYLAVKQPSEHKEKTTVHPDLFDPNEILLFELKTS